MRVKLRCEQTVGNSPAEIDATTAAARTFLRAEMEVRAGSLWTR